MKLIPLTKGRFALVDDSDYPWLSQLRWCYSSDGYAVNYYRDEYGIYHRRSMHRLIMARMLEQFVPPDLQVDHINHDRIDNQRNNLRLATRSQNQAYKKLQVSNSTGYKGVIWNRSKWEVRIRYQGRKLYLGRYDDPIQAALVYDGAARLLYQEFAGLNFPQRPTPFELRTQLITQLQIQPRAA
jgi:hypothetical protein